MNAIAKDIYEAAVYGDVEIVKRLLKSATFADLIYKNPNDLHKTAVMVAAYHGHTEIVRAIFKHSIASVHIQDEQGWTALMFAAFRGHTSTINAILLHPEVDVNVKNNLGWTALMMAASQGHAASVRALLARSDIDVNAQNTQDGGTALLLAAMKGHTDIVRDILSLKGVLVNLEDKEGRIAVFAAQNDEITALINFYDPVLGLVYPLPDLPPPPHHTVALMPPLPPAHEPKLALSVEYQECYDAVHALLPLLPSIYIRGAWHQQRLALQHQMEAAVHIRHHKEAALIGREFLAFKATTASTAALRALSEQDYLHLPEKVTLLQQRLASLCADLSHVQDYQTLKKVEELVTGLNDVQRALTESAVPPSTKAHFSSHSFPPPLPPASHPAVDTTSTTSASPRTSRPASRAASPEPVHAKVHFVDPTLETDAPEQEGERDSEVLLPPPPPPHNTPAHVHKKSSLDADSAADISPRSPDKACAEENKHAEAQAAVSSLHGSAHNSANSSPKHTITSTISAIPELDYLPHYSAYSNTVPSGAFELHTAVKSFEELMVEKNKSAHSHEDHHGGLPPPPPPGGH
eukprot:CAMPEP_0184981820 /NCGR_PEP_ID=MMETSP1098-20130426/11415_1 /TAXON_ID=89044 /ORGANISM="Spumella elongata, Strain CCAP 955/1" /LENGTH=577 /DNA_ID=CAMNT_0027505417 /DNA_START=81 /DNA_END=1814 /DNA_ORIENTATION=-